MKKAWLFIFPLILFSCKGGGLDASAFLAERDSIMEVNSRQQKELESLTTVMDIISTSLDSIARQEQLIYFSEKGDRLSKRDVLDNLRYFEELLERQRKQIGRLQDSLQYTNSPSTGKFTNIVAFLNQQLDEKDKTIQTLRKNLSKKNVDISKLQVRIDTLQKSVSSLVKKNEVQIQALSTQDMMLNEGYVKVGTRQELQAKNLLTGNFFKRKVNYSNLNKSDFTKVDIRSFTEIRLNSKRPKILTAMPESSYRFEKDSEGATLYITNPTEFWSVSNYLIIQTN